jgi:osmoprotectant transport system permease protein
MELLADVIAWLSDPANWTGDRGLLMRLWEHTSISVLGTVLAAALALPPALLLGHLRRGGFVAVTFVNLGRAVPSFGVVGVMFPITLAIPLLVSPLGFWATLIALVLLAMPPMFVNTYTGVSEVDPALVESAKGMGMTGSQVLRSVELPLAMPLVMAGVRTGAVAVVATATLGAVVGFGGLGRYIIDGFAQGNDVLIIVGGLFVAIGSILTELGLGWLERRSDPLRHNQLPERRIDVVEQAPA